MPCDFDSDSVPAVRSSPVSNARKIHGAGSPPRVLQHVRGHSGQTTGRGRLAGPMSMLAHQWARRDGTMASPPGQSTPSLSIAGSRVAFGPGGACRDGIAGSGCPEHSSATRTRLGRNPSGDRADAVGLNLKGGQAGQIRVTRSVTVMVKASARVLSAGTACSLSPAPPTESILTRMARECAAALCPGVDARRRTRTDS
jgi:hypothetical protein